MGVRLLPLLPIFKTLYSFCCIYVFLCISHSGFAQTVNVESYKVRVVEAIIKKIAVAYGRREVPKLKIPNLNMNPDKGVAAFIDNKIQYLFVDEYLYDFCRETYLKDSARFTSALACFIAHEMVHYYEHNGRRTDFFGSCDLLPKDRESLEIEADRKGLWLAMEAGFEDVPSIASFIFPKVYDAYKIADKIAAGQSKCYPTKKQRMDNLEKEKEKAESLFIKFRKAKLCYLFGEYEDAAGYLKEMSNVVQHDEVLNNWAVAEINQVLKDMLKLSDKDSVWRQVSFFEYPLDINAFSRIRGGRGDDDDISTALKARLKHALQNLQKIDVSKKDESVLLNMATALILFNEPDSIKKALTLLNKVKDTINKNDKLLLRGIAAILQGETIKAKDYFYKLPSDDRNRSTFIQIYIQKKDETDPLPKSESCDRCKIPRVEVADEKCTLKDNIHYCQVKGFLYAYSDKVALCDVKINQLVSDLPKCWHKPSRIVQTREGSITYHCFDDSQTILVIQKGHIVAWMMKDPPR